jgi:dTMP kinase
VTTGLFITFEGGEGSGKSTQIKRLDAALRSQGHAVLVTREPGGSPGAEAIRALLVTGEPDRWDGVTEALLHYAARRDHVERVVKLALAEGKIVLCDRFADSTIAYQGYGHGLGKDFIANLHALTLGNFKPHLTLILDVPVEQGLGRANSRGDGERRYEDMDVAFHQRLRDGFLNIAQAEPERCKVIDGSGSEDAVAGEVLLQVQGVLGPGHG